MGNRNSQKRALVIGNNDYPQGRLSNCVHDANAIAKSLQSLGFYVDFRKNLTTSGMYEKTDAFQESIEAREIVLFYYSGHGAQHNGDNFLLGIDAGQITPNNIMNHALNAQHVIQSMARNQPKMIIFILDCCRTYPNTATGYGKSSGFRSGLAPMTIKKTRDTHTNPAPNMNTIIAFSCAENAAASDESRHGPFGTYTYHLIPHMSRPDTDVKKILTDVALAVQRDTNGMQIPYLYTNFEGEAILSSVFQTPTTRKPQEMQETHSHSSSNWESTNDYEVDTESSEGDGDEDDSQTQTMTGYNNSQRGGRTYQAMSGGYPWQTWR